MLTRQMIEAFVGLELLFGDATGGSREAGIKLGIVKVFSQGDDLH